MGAVKGKILKPKEDIRTVMEEVGHSMFVIDNRGKIEDSYFITKARLGEGSFGRVCQCHNKSTSAVRAVKIIRKTGNARKDDLIWYEVTLMKMISHPNVCRIFEHFQDKKFIYIVIERLYGKDLHDAVVQSGHLTEKQAAMTMYQVFRGVYYMHTSQIAHRDLKPENIMYSREEPYDTAIVKLIDLGHARVFDKMTWMTTKCGAVYYVSPQLLAGRYNELTDMWTLGVVLYIAMCGYPPFSGESDAEILSKVRLGNYKFAASDWMHGSNLSKDVVRGCLKLSPIDRMTPSQGLSSEWIHGFLAKQVPKMNLLIVDSFRQFRRFNALKKAALYIIVGHLDDEILRPLRDLYAELDYSGDGLISATEIRIALRRAGIKKAPDDLDEIIMDMDADGSGEIDYSEFLAATLDVSVYTREEVCWTAFRVFDRNGDGHIVAEELVEAMNNGDPDKSVTLAMAEDLIRLVDETGDKCISLREFVNMMQGVTKPYVYKTDRQKEKEVRARKRKEGTLKMEDALLAARAYQEKGIGGITEVLTARSKEGQAAAKGKAASEVMAKTLHLDLSRIEERFGDDEESQELLREHLRKLRLAMEGVDFQRGVYLEIFIVSAEVKGPEEMDLWAIAEIPGKNQRVETKQVQNSNTPEWLFKGELKQFWKNDILDIIVMDHPVAPAVGKVSFPFAEIVPGGFTGRSKLKVGHRSAGTITLKILVHDKQHRSALCIQRLIRAKIWRIRAFRYTEMKKREKKAGTLARSKSDVKSKSTKFETSEMAEDKHDVDKKQDVQKEDIVKASKKKLGQGAAKTKAETALKEDKDSERAALLEHAE